MRTLAPFLACLLSSIAFAAIPLGPERALSEARPVTAEGRQRDVQIATSGEETLVAWIDETPGRAGAYIAEIEDDGSHVDGSQRLLAEGANWVQLTWSGASYLAFWEDAGSIVVTELDRRGRSIETRVASRIRTPLLNSIAWAGQRGAALQGRYLTIFDRTGKAISSSIDVASGSIIGGHVVSDGQTFFVFWQRPITQSGGGSMTEIYTRRFAADGLAMDFLPVLIATAPRLSEEWDVAFGENRFALIAAESVAPGESMLRTFLYNPATRQTTTLPPSLLKMVNEPRIEWLFGRFVALWFRSDDDADTSTLFSQKIAIDGTVDPPISRKITTQVGRQMREVWNGRALLVAYNVRGDDPGDVFATHVIWGADIPYLSFAVARSPEWQAMPSVATNGVESLAVWTEGYVAPGPFNPASLRVFAAHMTDGVVDTQPLHLGNTIAGVSPSQTAVRPSVVFTGEMYLVLWPQPDPNSPLPRILMKRIDAHGRLLHSKPIELGRGYTTAMAFNGTNVLFAWGTSTGVIARLLRRDGIPFNFAATQVASSLPDDALAVSCNGKEFLVVWSQGHPYEFPTQNFSDIYAARVSAAGLLAGNPIPVAVGLADQDQLAVASDGRDFLIAYIEDGGF